jgi:hypothetical protein
MVRDHLEQPLAVGDQVIWCNYNRLYMGVVLKVMAKRVRLKNAITGWEHQPWPSKIVKVEALPPAALFAAIKGRGD